MAKKPKYGYARDYFGRVRKSDLYSDENNNDDYTARSHQNNYDYSLFDSEDDHDNYYDNDYYD